MWSRLSAFWDRFWGWVLILAALSSGGVYYDDVREQEQRSRCQQIVNKAFTDNIVERSKISVASDQAQSNLLLGVAQAFAAKPTTDPKEQEKRSKAFLKLFSDFEAATAEVTRLRAETPFPNLDTQC